MAGRGAGAGSVRRLPSGRWQVRYRADGQRRTAPATFATKRLASAWLARQVTELASGDYRDPRAGLEPLAEYADRWMAERTLKPRTRAHYRSILDRHIVPTFGALALAKITPASVKTWHADLNTGPTMRAHAYGLLRTVLGSAVRDDLIPSNPCRVRGAGSARRVVQIRPATLTELEQIAAAMPDRLRLMVQLAAWCGLRFGELAELRRHDITADCATVNVRRGVVRVKGERIVGDPKSEAGTRTVAIPPHLAAPVANHLREHTGEALDSLLFPAVSGGHLATRTLYDSWYPAREAAKRPDLRFHDLRHTGATLAAAAGADLALLMRRLGHSTPYAALRYQHAVDERDRDIASVLSDFASAKVIPLRPRQAGSAGL